MNPEKRKPEVEDLLLNELEECDWDLNPESLETIARRLRGHFRTHHEALEFVYSMVSSMFDGDLGRR